MINNYNSSYHLLRMWPVASILHVMLPAPCDVHIGEVARLWGEEVGPREGVSLPQGCTAGQGQVCIPTQAGRHGAHALNHCVASCRVLLTCLRIEGSPCASCWSCPSPPARGKGCGWGGTVAGIWLLHPSGSPLCPQTTDSESERLAAEVRASSPDGAADLGTLSRPDADAAGERREA